MIDHDVDEEGIGITFADGLCIADEGTTMPNVTVSVPHQLGRVEARRRIEQQIRELKAHFGQGFATLEDRWVGDELSFQLSSTGQTITGRAVVEEQQVWIEVELPWFLAALANLVRQEVKDRGRLLLGNMATTGRPAGT